MGDNDVSVESVELALLSEIEQSSAALMKDAYLPPSEETTDEERFDPGLHRRDSPREDELAGPNAKVFVTRVSTRTPPEEIEKILSKNPDRRTNTGTHEFYTMVLMLSMRMADPSTTHFINGTVNVAFPNGMKILTYAPKEKGVITAIIGNGRDALSLSPGLDSISASSPGTKAQPDYKVDRFEITVGPGEKITGTYSKKSGFTLNTPAGTLLDYQGLLKTGHEMFWEIYPPMPGLDIEITGKEILAIFSFIIRAPKNSPPAIDVRIEGRVKGNLWGVIPVRGSVVIPGSAVL